MNRTPERTMDRQEHDTLEKACDELGHLERENAALQEALASCLRPDDERLGTDPRAWIEAAALRELDGRDLVEDDVQRDVVEAVLEIARAAQNRTIAVLVRRLLAPFDSAPNA